MYFPFRHDANYKESSLINSTPTSLDSGSVGGRPFTAFSAQSGSTPVFHHGGNLQGLHNVQGSYNMQTPNSLSSRNSGLASVSSSGVHQPSGTLPTGRFAANNLPIGLSQLSQGGLHGHNTMSNRANISLIGSHPLSSGMNGSGVSGPPGTVTISNRGSLAGLGVSLSQMGSTGTRIPTSGSAIASGGGPGGNLNRALNAGSGLSVPTLGGSRGNMGPVNSGGGLGLQGQGRPMSPMLQQTTNMSSSMYNSSSDLMAIISSRANLGQISANGQLSNVGMSNDGSSNDGVAFDINDFPLLSNRPTSGGGLQGPVAGFRKQGVSINSIGQQNQEFSIQNEDFPALPGFKGGSVDINSELHHKERQHESALSSLQQQHFTMGRSAGFPLGVSFLSHRQQQQQHHQLASGSSTIASGSLTLADSSDSSHLHTGSADAFHPHGLSAAYHSQVHAAGPAASGMSAVGLRTGGPTVVPSGLSSYDQLIHQYDQHQQPHFRVGALQQQQQQQLGTVGPPSRDLALRAMQDTQVSADRFGLLGLLSVIRMTDADLTTLALGTDLTTLGLNLNSRENLYKTFASPWADGPIKGEPEFILPQCYMLKISPELQPGNFAKFQQDTLFYIFYSMPNDVAQLYAAYELCKRGWFYHKVHQMWLTRVPNTEPLVKTSAYERGSYYIFDPNTWETGRKENFVLQYELLEKQPQLPSELQQI
ncbi:hypothetical protein O6H91_03G098700 [Diphasiastrum complanatum]|uniref:Uncharacterized protein n=3 Tax=Diphasiastrum complanatum TaxID=34168 RepID=A0ACC2E9Y6_DIPCM|nr:hypothetical protein O6H91_03G098700 [Diphasiastrum complanatum]KAJ7563164.1 hypothetical protein O6H91_03G098700 [Diphasiastrum complanatum]KAJ7563165.1 hypothetical protein O6H91_03G098700 [Diphasiastrum complanatum]